MTAVRAGFGRRLADAVAARGALCVGIDPHPALLHAWGLEESPAALERFAMTAVEALAGEVAVLKPQSAFFEVYGSAGVAVLEKVVAASREAGALVLLDVKRGDIGSTMTAYANAYLDEHSPLAADALTVSPYLGFGSLAPALGIAEQTGRGVFVLARTSNPEGVALQRSTAEDGRTVAQSIVDAAAENNAGADPFGYVGVVAGATIKPGELDFSRLNGPILAPGLGAQGATVQGLRATFGAALPSVLPATARDVLGHGPSVADLRSAARRVRDELGVLLES
ncbi:MULTISPECIES: orotidine-5'-phosphate decarboxylase [Saccharopolyspora]|uniref:Orotidine 5'-phosphate decarboxylase n=1 Tax=Saccharopolyspora gregorii TaxID=33914 RepID=A0ABP6RTW6_9PSEU|nr:MULTISPECIES: orotidine-5'-phosphate decarboxylase [Saccharopolyspora]MCA1188061.1 orotidine-5'-phosphate decarboxylase [Saccharopolyspora sp. 6T]MCA1225667.1 orotidine-5'-phosphate decarboxylase [Saccharopolyspora sp. 6M]MCA1281242.1 orotidine-5'-phosphate decarboxylase [Saccharopolyspora sp. 7B]